MSDLPQKCSHKQESVEEPPLNVLSNQEIYMKLDKKFPVSIGNSIAWDSNHIYGEVVYSTLYEILTSLSTKGLIPNGAVFYDLGSGIGKAVVAAALIHGFSKCCGIELLPDLYRISLELREKYEMVLKKYGKIGDGAALEFYNADILESDWRDCDVFFINSTCFDEDFMTQISNFPLKPGTIAISTSKRLNKSQWTLIETSKRQMSWGSATVFIHRKK